MRERTGLTCSIGITPNKLLSKIASELDKPDGLTLLGHADIAARIWPLRGAQGQRHRPEGRREARRLRHPHDRRHRRAPIRRSWSSTSARATAPGCTRPRTAATSAPSSPTASRSRSAARPPSSATCTRCATAPSSARSSPSCANGLAGDLARKGYAGAHARHQAALRRLQDRHPRPDAAGAHAGRARASAAPPASA